ncbi:MAG: hypothetical protein R2713_20565 [Ilumatobacteraceae bacterium]
MRAPCSPSTCGCNRTWDTAVAACHRRPRRAVDALIGGRILLSGDQQKLMSSQLVFAKALDAVCSPWCASATEYV